MRKVRRKVNQEKSQKSITHHRRRKRMETFQKTVKKTILTYLSTPKSHQNMGKKKMERETARKRVAKTGVN